MANEDCITRYQFIEFLVLAAITTSFDNASKSPTKNRSRKASVEIRNLKVAEAFLALSGMVLSKHPQTLRQLLQNDQVNHLMVQEVQILAKLFYKLLESKQPKQVFTVRSA